MSTPRYLWKAFWARPFGMPIPPNLFGLTTFGLLGAFLNPGFWVLGAGLEIAYLALLSGNARFRRTVDAERQSEDPQDQRYASQLGLLDRESQGQQSRIEARSREIFATLNASPMLRTHVDSLEQLVWLHLRLLVARRAILGVVETASVESQRLDQQEQQIEQRLAATDLSPELRRSLEQQKSVIDQRQAAHLDAQRRLEHVDAELARIDQQIALIREQALLSTNEYSIGSSLDALAASFNEANRWLSSQRDLLEPMDLLTSPRLPERVLKGPPPLPGKRPTQTQ